MKTVFHESAVGDYNEIMAFFEDISTALAERFEAEFRQVLAKALNNPFHFHPLAQNSDKRRANIRRYNHHFIYEVDETAEEIRILTIRHDHRRPSYGLNRRWPES